MGKNHRHKKNLKAEKAKVKLKDKTKTKFLPKGQNITKVEFKVKPIVLPEQLKEKDTGSPLSKRKLNVKDLLSRLKHYNASVKLSACEELDALVKTNPEEVAEQHLPELLKTVSNLVQDEEKKVRKAASKAINAIMAHNTLENIEPYFEYLMVNLKCAMLHINRNVQEDSLLLLDAILKHTPSLITKESNTILPTFFSLISKLKSDAHAKRTLTVNLGSNMVSIDWHIKVLSRLFGLLKAIIGDGEKEDEYKSKPEIIKYTGQAYIPLYKNAWSHESSVSIFDLIRKSKISGEIEHGSQDYLKKQFSYIIPLLHEIWMEALPETVGQIHAENTVLNEGTVAILCCILRILHMFLKYAEIKKETDDNSILVNIFSSKATNKFVGDIIKYFPYRLDKAHKESKSLKEIGKYLELSQDANCIRENLLVCDIYIKISMKNDISGDISSVMDYIITCLTRRYFIKRDNMDFFFSLLKLILIENPGRLRRKGVNVKEILDRTIDYYSTINSYKDQMKLCNVLLGVLENPALKHLDKYDKWLAHFPEKLTGPEIPSSLVLVILHISKRSIDSVYSALLSNLENILISLPKAKIVVDDDHSFSSIDKTKSNIAFIYFYVPKLDIQHIQLISAFLEHVDDPVWKHAFSFMLRERICCRKIEETDEIKAILNK